MVSASPGEQNTGTIHCAPHRAARPRLGGARPNPDRVRHPVTGVVARLSSPGPGSDRRRDCGEHRGRTLGYGLRHAAPHPHRHLSLPDDPWLVATRISGTYAPHPSVALRLQQPLTYADPGDSEGEFGTGDLSTRVLWRAWNHPRVAAFVGLELFFPTASNPLLGTEKYSLAPTAAAFFQVLDNVFFIPVYQ